MNTSSGRSSIVIFCISMSLVLVMALGIYSGNRVLAHWLLTRSLENTYSPAVHLAANAAQEMLAAAEQTQSRPDISGLRLSKAGETVPSSGGIIRLEPDRMAKLRASAAPNDVAAAWIVRFNTPDLTTAAIREVRNSEAGDISASQIASALSQVAAVEGQVYIPAVNWRGQFGDRAIIGSSIRAGNGETQGVLILVDQNRLLTALQLPILAISIVVGILCASSFLFAGILLWMRFADQVRTNLDIQYLAHHDTLTGLPNRAVFNARLTEALRIAQAKATNMGVMLIDVDKFKQINDTYGHGTGDVFLQIIADRLKSVFGAHLVARLSGDEFAVMLSSMSDVARLTRIASDMIRATDAPCVIEGKEIKISLSIGIARASDGSWRSSRLLHCADLALYRAKHSGRSTFAWYKPEMDAEASKRKEIEEGLIKALKFDQFSLLFQPQYSLIDNQLKGYEALIRWEHPIKGNISPELFIPVAEDTGLIVDIGKWVLDRACQEAASWQDQSLRVAVNVSAAQFVANETHGRVAEALKTSGLAPERLEIEITESLLIANTKAVVETLEKVRAMGVAIAMDDFGTGYSSLSYLSKFPFDKIKIDRSFIHNLGEDPSTDAIVTAIIGLGKSLDVVITAEGIETEAQVAKLREAGCTLAQGYLYGRPDSVSVHEANRKAVTDRAIQAEQSASIGSAAGTPLIGVQPGTRDTSDSTDTHATDLDLERFMADTESPVPLADKHGEDVA